MNLVADECCDALMVDGLRGDGHDVVYVKEIAPGADDDTIRRDGFGRLCETKWFVEIRENGAAGR